MPLNVSDDERTRLGDKLIKKYKKHIPPLVKESKRALTIYNETYIKPAIILRDNYVNSKIKPQFIGDVANNTNKHTKIFFLLHKLYKIAEEKSKFLTLVNLPADKPTSIEDIYNFENKITDVLGADIVNRISTEYFNFYDPKFTVNENTENIIAQVKEWKKDRMLTHYDESTGIPSEYKSHSPLLPNLGIRADNIFEKNPHIAVALVQTLIHIGNLKREFLLFSPKAESVFSEFLPYDNVDFINRTAKAKVLGLYTLSDMILSNAAEHLLDTPSIVVQASKDGDPYAYTGVQAFVKRLIEKIKAVEDYEMNL